MTRRLADVAKKVGVSEATVSRVLNGRPGVSESTRAAVLTALDVFGHERPTQLRGDRTRLVGLVDQIADGINLHQGVSEVRATNNFLRNTGDDGMAMWSEGSPLHAGARFNEVPFSGTTTFTRNTARTSSAPGPQAGQPSTTWWRATSVTRSSTTAGRSTSRARLSSTSGSAPATVGKPSGVAGARIVRPWCLHRRPRRGEGTQPRP